MLGRIEKLDYTRNNRPFAVVDGEKYMLPKEMKNFGDLTVGRKIDFEGHSWTPPDSKTGKPMWFIDKWGLVPEQAAAANGNGSTAPQVHIPNSPPLAIPIDPSEAGILKSLIEAGVIREKHQYKEWLDFIRHPFMDKMKQIAEKSAQTKLHNEQAGRILDAFKTGAESTALQIWLESMKGSEKDATAVWVALPTTVQQRLKDLRDEKNLHGESEFTDEPNF